METKKCPFCGGEIMSVARKCKHCGEWLDKQEHPDVVSQNNHAAELKEMLDEYDKPSMTKYLLIIGAIIIVILLIVTCTNSDEDDDYNSGYSDRDYSEEVVEAEWEETLRENHVIGYIEEDTHPFDIQILACAKTENQI